MPMRTSCCVAIVSLTIALAAARCAGDGCVAGWARGLFKGGAIDATIRASVIFDDGTGPALYVAGHFERAGSTRLNHVAKWDGKRWVSVGGGMDGSVYALAVLIERSGSALYAAGEFTTAGGTPASNVAKWNGSSWGALGSGTDGPVYALCAAPGPLLYAGGAFAKAGGVPTGCVALWRGDHWTATGSLMAGSVVESLAWVGPGSGALEVGLYAAGAFLPTPSAVCRLTSIGWSVVGYTYYGGVRTLTLFDDGSGPALYAGGSFTRFGVPGELSAPYCARWDGTAWTACSGAAGAIHAFGVFDGKLHAGGEFAGRGVAEWDGSNWTTLASNTRGNAYTLSAFESGAALFAGGSFSDAGGLNAQFAARYDGSSWSRFGLGTEGEVYGVKALDLGTGPALYAVGSSGEQVLRRDSTGWSPLCSRLQCAFGAPYLAAVEVFDDRSGPALYVAGRFTSIDGVAASGVAKWTGSVWQQVGSGLNGDVNALAVYNGALYAGGRFRVTGYTQYYLARWDGASWFPLFSAGLLDEVFALAVWKGALYVGGRFDPSGHIGRFDGSNWFTLTQHGKAGLNDEVHALAVLNDGSGPALHVGGRFTSYAATSPPLALNRVAKWDGSAWSALGSGFDDGEVRALAVLDDGSALALYAAGGFFSGGGTDFNGIAKWSRPPRVQRVTSGEQWTALAGGITEVPEANAVAAFDDGAGPALFVGGGFTKAGDYGSVNLARWGCEQAAERVGTAKRLPCTGLASLGGVVSTAVFGDGFYIEEADRSNAIRVQMKSHGVAEGELVNAVGRLAKTDWGEIFIDAWDVSHGGSGAVEPVAMSNRDLGGGPVGVQGAVWGWRAQFVASKWRRVWAEAAGLNNIGLLVRAAGRLNPLDESTFNIDDGTEAPVKCFLPSGVTLDSGWTYALVTGISSCERVGNELRHVIRVRYQSDLQGF